MKEFAKASLVVIICLSLWLLFWSTTFVEKVEQDRSATFLGAVSLQPDTDDEPFVSRGPTDVMPRTSHAKYNVLNDEEKYFMYSPSGGFNNQRTIIAYSLEIGRLLGRTVIIPMAGKHTSGWSLYERLKYEIDVFPMDRVVDFAYLSEYAGVKVLPLDVPIRTFTEMLKKQLPKREFFIRNFETQLPYWGTKAILKFKENQEKVIFFRGPQMYHKWFAPDKIKELESYVRYSSYIRKLALLLSNKLGTYNAIHVRLGDYAEKAASSKTYVKQGLQQGFKRNETLYVATEPTSNKNRFQPLFKAFDKVVFLKDLDKEILKDFEAEFPTDDLRNDMIGLVEQVVCALAKNFIGSWYSNFSKFIYLMRERPGMLLPEARRVDDDEVFVHDEEVVREGDSSETNGAAKDDEEEEIDDEEFVSDDR